MSLKLQCEISMFSIFFSLRQIYFLDHFLEVSLVNNVPPYVIPQLLCWNVLVFERRKALTKKRTNILRLQQIVAIINIFVINWRMKRLSHGWHSDAAIITQHNGIALMDVATQDERWKFIDADSFNCKYQWMVGWIKKVYDKRKERTTKNETDSKTLLTGGSRRSTLWNAQLEIGK